MWRSIEPSSPVQPPMRSKCAAEVVGNSIYVFGGLGAGAVGEFWRFDISTLKWESLSHCCGPTPAGRSSHTLTKGPDANLWLFGGQSGSKRGTDVKKDSTAALRVRMLGKRNVLNDLHRFDIEERRWHLEQMTGVTPSPRRGHTATLVLGRKAAKSKRSHGGSDADQGTGGSDKNKSFLASLESQMAARAKQAEADKQPPAQEIFVLGGAGPDPGKGFEVIQHQLWILDLRSKTWSVAETKGLAPEVWARLEHTATVVPGGLDGFCGGSSLIVVGGVSLSSMEIPETGHGPPTYNWGHPESRVLALDTDTLTWTELANANKPGPESLLLGGGTSLSNSYHADDEDVVKPPAVHGHSTVISPLNPRELLIFGGRGPRPASNEVYHLKLPDAYTPPPPKAQLSPRTGIKLGMKEKVGHKEDETMKQKEKLKVSWDCLPVDAEETPPACRYGHVCVAWTPEVVNKRRRPASNQAKEQGSSNDDASKSRQRHANTASGGPASNGARVDSEHEALDESRPTTPGLLLYGGSLLTNKGQEQGYASPEVHFLDMKQLSQSSVDSTADGLSALEVPASARSLRSARSHTGLRSARDLRTARSNMHRLSNASQPNEMLEEVDSALPSNYGEMKSLLLSQRPDYRTSKIRKGDRPRTAPFLSQRKQSVSASALAPITQTATNTTSLRGSSSTASLMSATGGQTGGRVLSTMNFSESLRLHVSPAPAEVLENAHIVGSILQGSKVKEPPSTGKACLQLSWKNNKKEKKTQAQLVREKWRVPGLEEQLNPPPKPVVTIHDARLQFKFAMEERQDSAATLPPV